MDFDEFCSKIGSKDRSPAFFHLLDRPILVRDRSGGRYSIFALAWTHDEENSSTFTYALGLESGLGKFSLAVVRQWDCTVLEAPWEYSRRFFFKEWILSWIEHHPNDLINGAIAAANIDWELSPTA